MVRIHDKHVGLMSNYYSIQEAKRINYIQYIV